MLASSVPDNMHKPIENWGTPISPTDTIPISHTLHLDNSPIWPTLGDSPSQYAYIGIIPTSPTLHYDSSSPSKITILI